MLKWHLWTRRPFFPQCGWRPMRVWTHYTLPLGAGGRSSSNESVAPERSPQFHTDMPPKTRSEIGSFLLRGDSVNNHKPSCRLKMFNTRASGGWVLCSISVGVWNSHIWTHLLPENRAIWPFAGCGFNEESVIFYRSLQACLTRADLILPPPSSGGRAAWE